MSEHTSVFPFEKPFTMMLAGHTGSGKTTLMVRILKQVWDQFDYVYIMSRTLHLNDDYKDFPENENPRVLPIVRHIGDDFEGKTITIRRDQEQLIEQNISDAPDILIVYEDQANTRLTQFRGMLDQFALLSRHYKISMIFSTQRITAIGRTIRLNTKYFILFPQSNFSELERFLMESVPMKYKRIIRDHIETIFKERYTFIIVDQFNPVIRERLWLHGTVPLLDFLDTLSPE